MLFQLASLLALATSTYLPSATTQARLPLQTDTAPLAQVLPQETVRPPLRDPKMLGVKIKAKAAVVIDKKSGAILFDKNARMPLPEASLTKIMTAITVLDNPIRGDDIVAVTKHTLEVQPFGADLNLKVGERISVYNLLRSLLIVSANDAAVALAEYVAGDEQKFVALMNQKAKALGLKNSNFKNTHGLDTDGHYSSAYDLALMTRYALDKAVYREISSTPRFVYETSVRTHWLKNTNILLDYPYLDFFAGKTGFTDNAGQCLMEAARDKKGHEIIIVVLNSEERWQEAKALAEWTFRAYAWPQ